MDYREQARAVGFGLTAAFFFISLLSGLTYAIFAKHRLPSISLQYLAEADSAFAAGEFEKAAAKYRVAATIAPDDDRALYWLGTALHETGDLRDAVQAYRQVLQLNPADKVTHYNLALALAEEGSLDAAVQHSRLALRLDSTYVEAHTNLALVLLRQGHRDEAGRHLEVALRLRPGFPPAARALAALRDSRRPQ